MAEYDYTKPMMRRILPDGRILELWLMAFNWRITVTRPEDDGISHDDMWCFKRDRLGACVLAFETFDGTEPAGWNKHPPSGRWREDGTAESEINQRAVF